MKSLADALPPAIAQQVHPEWRKNEANYWAVRDELLAQYECQWIGFADGRVVASGDSPVDVLHASQPSSRHPFFICVGREDEPCRIRRSTFAYDRTYASEALPLLRVEFRKASDSPGEVLDRVIPDTGADASVLPWSDCQLLRLDVEQGVPAVISGIAGGVTASITFHVWVRLDGQDYPSRLQADFSGTERILGRDVLDRLEILFRGPSGEVVVNP
jgi:predicted aspartyl protease